MRFPFTTLIIIGNAGSGKSWLIQRIADSRSKAIVFTPSHQNYQDYCRLDWDLYNFPILDDLTLWNKEAARETVQRMEAEAIENEGRLAFALQHEKDLEYLGIQLQTDPMLMYLSPDNRVTLKWKGTEEVFSMNMVHHWL